MSIISPSIICTACQSQFKCYDLFYYCCDSNEAFCTRCSRTLCQKCSQLRQKTHEVKTCCECYERHLSSSMYFDYASENSFCSSCVRKAYEAPDHHQLVFLKKWSQVSRATCDRAEVELYLKTFCNKCNKKLSFQELKEVNNDLSICDVRCWKCSGRMRKKYVQKKDDSNKNELRHNTSNSSLKKCNACGFTIYENKGFITEDYAICEMCAKFSSYAQSRISEAIPADSSQGGKERSQLQNYQKVDKKIQRRQVDNSIQRSQRYKKVDNIVVNNQPQIVEDQDYRKQVNSPKHHHEKAQNLFKYQSTDVSSSQSKKSKDGTSQEQFIVPVKRNDSLKNLEGMLLNVPKDGKVITCKGCGYQILKEFIIQDKKQLKCRICFSEDCKAREKKQSPNMWKSSIPASTYSSKYSTQENRFKTPPKKANENYSHSVFYQQNKRQSNNNSFYSSHTSRNEWNSRSDNKNMSTKIETNKKSQTDKKSQRKCKFQTGRPFSNYFDDSKCQFCLNEKGSFEYMGKKVCLICRRKYMSSYR